MAQHGYRIGEIERAVVIAVRRIQARRHRAAAEEVGENEDGIGNVDLTVTVGVSALKERLRLEQVVNLLRAQGPVVDADVVEQAVQADPRPR